ncbi:hypothetical protein ACFV0B_36535 [Streptomyces xanthophaeus]|uniref:hypothetical protein n=1 Tax=Streptomyces xanthophaeus TaxID=67385 RepID=UPI00369BE377
MSGRRRLDWLGLTPEPERELPEAVAALRASTKGATAPGPQDPTGAGAEAEAGPAADADADAERRRLERLILRGSRRSWLRYLSEVTDLVTAVAAGTQPGDPDAALLAAEVVLDHHHMLIGLPGPGYGRTAADRVALESAVRTLRALHAPTPTGSSR